MLFLLTLILLYHTIASVVEGNACRFTVIHMHTQTCWNIKKKNNCTVATSCSKQNSDMHTHLGIYSSFSYTHNSCMHDTFLHMKLTHTFFPHHTSKFLILDSLCTKCVQVVKKGKKKPVYSNFCVKSVSFPHLILIIDCFISHNYFPRAPAFTLHLHCDDSLDDITMAASTMQTEK